MSNSPSRRGRCACQHRIQPPGRAAQAAERIEMRGFDAALGVRRAIPGKSGDHLIRRRHGTEAGQAASLPAQHPGGRADAAHPCIVEQALQGRRSGDADMDRQAVAGASNGPVPGDHRRRVETELGDQIERQCRTARRSCSSRPGRGPTPRDRCPDCPPGDRPRRPGGFRDARTAGFQHLHGPVERANRLSQPPAMVSTSSTPASPLKLRQQSAKLIGT